MVHFLAEISDKIPSVSFYWTAHLTISAVAFAFTVRATTPVVVVMNLLTAGWSVTILCATFTGEDPLRELTIAEMGIRYGIHQAVAAVTPLMATLLATWCIRKQVWFTR